MKLLIKYIVIIIVFSISPELHAGLLKGMFNVRQIGHTEGLSSQRVFSIVEDKHSVIWIATKSGIDRYNGQSVKNYTLQGNFYYGDMAGRRIQLLYSQQYGLWAYDHTGRIYRYVAKTDSFEQDLYLGECISGEIILNKLCMDSHGTLWIGLSKGLYRKDTNGKVSPVISGPYINDIICSGDSLFAGTSTGILQVSCTQPFHSQQWVKDKIYRHYTMTLRASNSGLEHSTVDCGLWT